MEVSPGLREELTLNILDAINMSRIIDYPVLGRTKRPKLLYENGKTSPQDVKTSSLISDIMQSVIRTCSKTHEHLLRECTMDLEPEVSSYWFVGGLELPRRSTYYTASRDEKSNQTIRYRDLGALHIRSKHPLSVLHQFDEPICNQTNYSESIANPGDHGYQIARRRLTVTAGFWPESDSFDYP